MLLGRNGCSLQSLPSTISHPIVRSLSHYFRVVGRILPWYVVMCLQTRYLGGHEPASSQDREYRRVLYHRCELKLCFWSWKRGWVWECSWNFAEAVALLPSAEYMVPSCKAGLSNRTETPCCSSSSSRSRGENKYQGKPILDVSKETITLILKPWDNIYSVIRKPKL